MSIPAFVKSFKTFGKHTESAGTAITENVQGIDNYTPALINASITTGATAHTMSICYAQGTGTRSVTTAASAAAATTLDVSVAPKDPAGNAAASGDVIAYQVSDGSWEFNTIASISSLEITLNTAIATAVPAGAKVRIFGVVADGACMQLPLAAAGTNTFGSGEIAIVGPYPGDPLYVSIDNATNASTINFLVFAYLNKSGGE